MKMKKRNDSIFKTLAELVYNKAIREEIEERVKDRYLKRIEYLVGANNELMKELEQYENVKSMKENTTIKRTPYGIRPLHPVDFDIQYHGKTKNYKQQKENNNDEKD